jgi:hypothetical protein
MKSVITLLILYTIIPLCQAQDSCPKVTHAEPLYLDLVRDMGARRGEGEWNISTRMEHTPGNLHLHPSIEYEWAILNRLALEVELPADVQLATPNPASDDTKPHMNIHSLRLATQWTTWVAPRSQFSAAVGYIAEGNTQQFTHQPFMVIAKRWLANLHSLLYVSHTLFAPARPELNLFIAYAVPRYRIVPGVEVYYNTHIPNAPWAIRPQCKVHLGGQNALGIVYDIHTHAHNALFLRWIYEPGRK